MGRLVDLFDQAVVATGTAKQAVDALSIELDKAKGEIRDLDKMKVAYDELMKRISAASAELADINQRVDAAKNLRQQLTELRHG